MTINWEEIFKKKYQLDNLGHFYILEPIDAQSDSTDIHNWLNSLLKELLTINDVQNHEDVLFIKPRPNSSYVLTDFTEFFSFLNYKAQRAKRKFIIIDQLDKFSHHVSNKLLKTLEEPPVAATIFAINNAKTKPLATVQSRAITLRINAKPEQTITIKNKGELAKYPSMEMTQIMDELKNNITTHEQFLNQLLSWCNEQCHDLKILGQIQAIITEYQQDELYHNAPTHRLYALAYLLKNASFSSTN